MEEIVELLEQNKLHHRKKITRIAHRFLIRMRHFFEGCIFWNQFISSIEIDECTKIAHTIAIVGSGKNCYTFTTMSLFEIVKIFLDNELYSIYIE